MTIARRTFMTGALMAGAVKPANAFNIKNLQSLIDKAIEAGGIVQLPAGTFATDGLKVNGTVHLQGVYGSTRLISVSGGPVLEINNAAKVMLSGLSFGGKQDAQPTDEIRQSALVIARQSEQLHIEHCNFSTSPFSGLRIEDCSGQISNCHFSKLGDYGLITLNSKGLAISSNVVDDIGNVGIAVWRSETGYDGTQILGNRVTRVRADSGGNGQNGNGISVYLAGHVITANNHVADTAFSSIRYNSGSNAQIIGNNLLNAGEASLYVEFSFQGAVVANNVIDGAGVGISIANMDVGGRLATCTGNIIRNIQHGRTVEAGDAIGIWVDADTLVANNVLEEIGDMGIRLGWGEKSRNLVAQGNIIRKTKRGIVVSTTTGTGNILVSGNVIDGATVAAVQGFDYTTAMTGDFPRHITVANNIVSP